MSIPQNVSCCPGIAHLGEREGCAFSKRNWSRAFYTRKDAGFSLHHLVRRLS